LAAFLVANFVLFEKAMEIKQFLFLVWVILGKIGK